MTTLKQQMTLKGRLALITGASGNLGRSIADTLAELGADLLLIDLPNCGLESFSKEVALKWGIKAEYYFCDLESQEYRKKTFDDICKKYSKLNILINNAAFVGTTKLDGWITPFQYQSLDSWRRAIEVNLTATFHLCQVFTPRLKVSESPSIINIGSIHGMYAPDWRIYEGTSMGSDAAYGVSKFGLIQLTRWLATTLAPEIRANAVSPGGIFRNQPETFVRRYEEHTPLKRMATEDDFKGIIAFLSSDLSRYVTGQNIAIDGGWGIW